MTETVDLHIERLAYGGDSIAHRPDGKTVFIRGGCPGDHVLVNVTTSRPGFDSAAILDILEPSADRIEPACPYHDVCGGCPWQHISYARQLDAKRTSVVDALVRIGSFDAKDAESLCSPTLASLETWGYRNKVEFEVRNTGRFVLGLHSQGGDLTAIDRCLLLPGKTAGAPRALGGALRFLTGDSDLGISRVGIRTSTRIRSTEVALWTKPGAFPRSRAAKVIGDALSGADVTRVLLKSTQKERSVSGVEVLSGKGRWTERICGEHMSVSAPSFFQVNTAAAEMLVQTVLDALEADTSSHVLDLYCGAGTFTLPLAERVDRVTGVESAGSSIRDLRRNLEERGLYAEVVGGDVARELPGLDEADAAVIDPPRNGLTTEVVDSLCERRLRRLVYVSCDPTTLARDLKMLTSDIYRLESVKPVDLFPQSYHIETVSVLTCAKARSLDGV